MAPSTLENPETAATRRALLASAGALTLAGCSRGAGQAGGQVLAAGQPAAILIWALAPERLLGWPRRPGPAALALLPPEAAVLAEIGGVTATGPQAGLEALAAAGPALALDYGDRDAGHLAQAERIRRALKIDYAVIDGALARIPEALVEAGARLAVEARAARLAGQARDILAAPARGTGAAFYYARGGDGLETGFRGSLATEVLESAGWTNVATGDDDIGRVAREQVAAWDPEVIVTLDAGFAGRASGDPLWSRRRDGSARRLVVLADAPFGWLDRPPSINRLLGRLWLGSRDPLGGPDPSLAVGVAAFHEAFYGRRPTPEQTLALLPRVIA